jgi:hypothetical protein
MNANRLNDSRGPDLEGVQKKHEPTTPVRAATKTQKAAVSRRVVSDKDSPLSSPQSMYPALNEVNKPAPRRKPK